MIDVLYLLNLHDRINRAKDTTFLDFEIYRAQRFFVSQEYGMIVFRLYYIMEHVRII